MEGSSAEKLAVENRNDVERAGESSSFENVVESNRDIVSWDGPNDPQNPRNFRRWTKGSNVAIVSCLCLCQSLPTSMLPPALPLLLIEFKGSNYLLATFVVTINVLGQAFGPLVWAPMSEVYGRMPVYHISNFCFCAFTIACAEATSLSMLIGFNFMLGIFGSVVLSNGSGTAADLISPENRGKALGFLVMGPILDGIIGPIAGSYLGAAAGWRWIFRLMAIFSGVLGILGTVILKETYGPAILKKKTVRLQKETGNMALRSMLDLGIKPKDFYLRAIVRPTKLLILSPTVLVISILSGVVYSYIYLLTTTFTTVFEIRYGFTSSTIGLVYIGMGLGLLLGTVFFGYTSDAAFAKKSKVALLEGEATDSLAAQNPEERLKLILPIYGLLPVGLFIYGWTAYYSVHWIVPIIASGVTSFGVINVILYLNIYLIDIYTLYAASAVAASVVLRSIIGATLPLAGMSMYKTLGLGWGNSLLAFIAIAFLPVPWSLTRWGARWRGKMAVVL